MPLNGLIYIELVLYDDFVSQKIMEVREVLFPKKEISSRSGKRIRAEIDLENVYLLPQTRGEEPDDLDTSDLVPSILTQGLLTPSLIGVFDKSGFAEYIRLTNEIHKSKLLAEDFSPNWGSSYWLVVIYGHRRFMACRRIAGNFPEGCIEKCSTEEGQAFLQLLREGRVKVDLAANPKAIVAKQWQCDENYHQGVESFKAAQVIGEMFRLEQIENPKITIAEFAEKYQIGEGKARDAVRYHALPKLIKEATTRKVIEYGHAVQIARYLAEVSPEDPEDKSHELLGQVIFDQPTVADFTKWISGRIIELKSPNSQLDLSDLMGETLSNSKESRRRKAADATNQDLTRILAHLRGMAFYCEHGLLPLEDSPLLAKENAIMNNQAIKKLGQIVHLLEAFAEVDLPHMKRLSAILNGLNDSEISAQLRIGERLAEKIERAVANAAEIT